ncbi:MAG: hypothetical protein QM526_02315 [Alphaproteobacteria bacterium]|nr:hypothetical protein [Alphaproteobacteria bacterium]
MNSKIVLFVGVVIVLALAISLLISQNSQSKNSVPLGDLAQCLKEKKAVFYGAFWCPHCAEQKSLFGVHSKSLPYVECSTPDRKSQTEVCKKEEIQSYPTWKLAIGGVPHICTGVVDPVILAEASRCAYQDADTPTETGKTLFSKLVLNDISKTSTNSKNNSTLIQEATQKWQTSLRSIGSSIESMTHKDYVQITVKERCTPVKN